MLGNEYGRTLPLHFLCYLSMNRSFGQFINFYCWCIQCHCQSYRCVRYTEPLCVLTECRYIMCWHVWPADASHTVQHRRPAVSSCLSMWRWSWLVACNSAMFTHNQFNPARSLLKHASCLWLVNDWINAGSISIYRNVINIQKYSRNSNSLFQ